MSGGSSESETSDDTVTPIRSPSTSTLRIETPCGHSRISPRRSSPVVIRENASWGRVHGTNPIGRERAVAPTASVVEVRTTQRKGDIATAFAIARFTAMGYDVAIPLTESAAY